MGKTALYKCYFEPAGCKHVNQDTLEAEARCLNAVEPSRRRYALPRGSQGYEGADEIE